MDLLTGLMAKKEPARKQPGTQRLRSLAAGDIELARTRIVAFLEQKDFATMLLEAKRFVQVTRARYRRLPPYVRYKRAATLLSRITGTSMDRKARVPDPACTSEQYQHLLGEACDLLEWGQLVTQDCVRTIIAAADVLRHAIDIRVMTIFIALGGKMHAYAQRLEELLDDYGTAMLGVQTKMPLKQVRLGRLKEEPLFSFNQGCPLRVLALRLNEALLNKEQVVSGYLLS
ncbi:hypothetical protein GMRT_13488 [Giardia muris]|uniref:Uncharacterized protein n=1 Tax=Giardia muris TaxID=5742 RepID=A0A4Z1T645_GIAMU|nr:hypothetical protein GMRT_13488 [Giardia muris]|eukprot:TNJ27999.1 hypothetical protein GMRT_13488 [Giardia muris]